jgi:predicted small secreted protein
MPERATPWLKGKGRLKMKKICLFVLGGLLALSIAGCGTIKGMGEDVSTVGRWLTKGSDTVKSPDTVKPDTSK